MVTARYYEDFMKEFKKDYEKDPAAIRQKMDELNLETLACLGYSAGAKIYSELTGIKLKEVGEKREYNG